jgi:thiol-disulfide isomerase/thioredoxin
MKGISRLFARGASVLALLIFIAASARADDPPTTVTNNADADKAWKAVVKATVPPMPPAEWQDKQPTTGEVAEFFAPQLVNGANTAKDFYTRFPNHPKAAEARKREYNLLSIAVNKYHLVSQVRRLETLQQERLNDPKLSDEEKFKMRFDEIQRLLKDMPSAAEEVETKSRALQKDFPSREEPYQVLLMVLGQSEGEKARALARVIVDSPAPEEIKAQARGTLNRLDALGKPVAIQFTAVDGREVDLAKLKGKVVLIDFWATWCGPCVAEVPNVKAAYEKLHAKGFEIVGISFDQKKDALEQFVKDKSLAWPQYFDGKGGANKFGQEFGIQSIPTMWLVDKQGKLRDMEGRDGLEKKVEKLRAEEPPAAE